MMKQNQKDLKPVQKAKVEKASTGISNSTKFTNKIAKDSFTSITSSNLDNNLVYLYW